MEYEQNLHISDSVFDGMREDADRVLQRLIKNMVEKDSFEGKVTISIDVVLEQEFIPNRDPSIEGETRRILTPKLSHKVGSVMQIKNEVKGDKNCDGTELVWDKEKGEYVLRPIANTDQMTIFDAEFRDVYEDVEPEEEEQQALEGRRVAALPGPSDEAEECEVVEEDMSEEFESEAPLPFSEGDDDFEYEEPDEF